MSFRSRPASRSDDTPSESTRTNELTGHARSLDSVQAALREFVAATLEGLLGDAAVGSDHRVALRAGQIREALEKISRRATQATSDVAEANCKKLKDKDAWWKLKLETVRVAIPTRLRNQAQKLAFEHEQQLDAMLRELRVRLTAELAGDGAAAALAAAQSSVDELHRKLDLLEAGSGKVRRELHTAQAELSTASTELGGATQKVRELEERHLIALDCT